MDLSEYSRFKRCLEWYGTDPEYRKLMDSSPSGAIGFLGYTDWLRNSDSVKEAILWELFRQGDPSSVENNPYASIMDQYYRSVSQKACIPNNSDHYRSSGIYSYEKRQQTRCQMECSLIRTHPDIFYHPFVFELSVGCSIQCPFCGFSAEKLSDRFVFTPENSALFRDVISAAFQFIGPVLGCCPLYFATEPLDNPDYEKFLEDFRNITGEFPQTTTAAADIHPEKIRTLLSIIGEDYAEENASLRFSIRSISQFRRIVSLFSPEETAHIEFLSNNPESVHRLSDSGRTAEGKSGAAEIKKSRYSISCAAGFKVNFSLRKIDFIEPELPDSTYPLGYRIRETQYFENPAQFLQILEGMADRYMFDTMPRHVPLCFNRNIRILEQNGLFLFLGDQTGYKIGKNIFTAEMVNGIQKGLPFSEIELRLRSAFRLSTEECERIFQAFNELFLRGYICTE